MKYSPVNFTETKENSKDTENGSFKKRGMRPCVKKILTSGLREKMPLELFNEVRKKTTYAIIHDLDRIGVDSSDIKQFLLQWNRKCIKPFSLSKAKRHLTDFVDWFVKKARFISCKSLADYCLYPEGSGCEFQKGAELKELTYTLGQAQVYLERTFFKKGLGFQLGQVLGALHQARNKKNVDILFIGLRTLAGIVFDIRGWSINIMDLSRILYRLEEAGFIEIERGERGSFGFKKSNSYTFLNWQMPTQGTKKDPLETVA